MNFHQFKLNYNLVVFWVKIGKCSNQAFFLKANSGLKIVNTNLKLVRCFCIKNLNSYEGLDPLQTLCALIIFLKQLGISSFTWPEYAFKAGLLLDKGLNPELLNFYKNKQLKFCFKTSRLQCLACVANLAKLKLFRPTYPTQFPLPGSEGELTQSFIFSRQYVSCHVRKCHEIWGLLCQEMSGNLGTAMLGNVRKFRDCYVRKCHEIWGLLCQEMS